MDSARRCQLPRPITLYYEELSRSSQYFSCRKYGYKNSAVLQNVTIDVDPFSIIETYIQTVVDNAIQNVLLDGQTPFWIDISFTLGGGKEYLVSWKVDDESYHGRLTEEFANSYKKVHRPQPSGKQLVIRTTIVTDPQPTL